MLRGRSIKYSLRWKRKGHQKHLQNFRAAVAGGRGWGCWVQVPPTSVLPLCPCAGAVLARLVVEGGMASRQTDRQTAQPCPQSSVGTPLLPAFQSML